MRKTSCASFLPNHLLALRQISRVYSGFISIDAKRQISFLRSFFVNSTNTGEWVENNVIYERVVRYDLCRRTLRGI